MRFLGLLLSTIIALTAALDIQDGQTGVLMSIPPAPTETGLKIPDEAHPFKAPGPDDQRGPCPAMNTLANHGLNMLSGISSFEEIVTGVMEVRDLTFARSENMNCYRRSTFNFDLNLAVIMTANNMLARGNVFTNKVSIGGVSPLVPPLPGQIDGPETGGIAKYGRIEGDASMTRADAFLGDNRNFQDILFDLALLQLGKFGDDGPDGNSTVFNLNTLVAIKKMNIAMDQAANPQFNLNQARLNAVYAGGAFIFSVFANGTTKQATLPIVGSFFRNQTFPDNWFRSATPVTPAVIGAVSGQIGAAVGVVAGRNNEGVYVNDPPPPVPWNSSAACSTYYSQNSQLPATLVTNSTGVLRQNVDLLFDFLFKAVSANPGCTQPIAPFGPAGV
ncbi:Cloroperoxidase [Mycena kentingensis (nom. inval.)]|nr:Cloroperoxidase [Mycena kentingensis (nom. inval.)]